MPADELDNVGDDCPIFDGLFEYCSISAGGSMGMYLLIETDALLSSDDGPMERAEGPAD